MGERDIRREGSDETEKITENGSDFTCAFFGNKTTLLFRSLYLIIKRDLV
ncbi:MAG: hypothetical protein QG664_164 [Patescibacteria group bacterium]|nr:hypothetical protein [Patescibacteria group bacterium]